MQRTSSRVISGTFVHLRRLTILSFILLTLAGCQWPAVLLAGATAAGQSALTPVRRVMTNPSGTTSSAVAAPTQPALDPATAGTNRLLVQSPDGNLFTVAPDGTGRFNLTSGTGSGWIYMQPTWSSTGERIAWTAIERTTDGSKSSLVTTLANGTEQTSADLPYPPFYLYWSPDDSKVAYLSNWVSSSGQSIALRSVDIAGGGESVTTLDIGQPYYFSWAPDSRQMIAHVGNRQVRLLSVAATEADMTEPTILVDGSANFAAPQWYRSADDAATAPVEGQLLYVLDDGNTAQLVLTDALGENQQFLTYLSRQDFVSFNMNATGSHIAYIETTNLVGFNSFGPLFIYDLEQEIFEQISTDRAIAFFWSPDGGALFFLTIELVRDQPWLRVNVWDGAAVRQFDRFIASPSFLRDYLRFADQYMQSMRFWSPDSKAVVYTGQAEDGSAGVWVQPVQGEQPAMLVAAGTFATWSPR